MRREVISLLSDSTDKGTVNIPGTANIGKVPAKGGISMGDYEAE